jgi:hypothetical protein
MKTSKVPSDLPDLERDLPTTPDDVRLLRERRPRPSANWLEELQALHDQFADPTARRRRRTFEGFEPFEL